MIGFVTLLAMAAACSGQAPTDEGARFFDRRVAPILVRSCVVCHNDDLDDGDISFENSKTLFEARKQRGPAIVPGKPDESPLVRAIRHDGEIQMPPGKKLAAADIDVLTTWVRQCAPWGKKVGSQK